jgi:hypothetical protein
VRPTLATAGTAGDASTWKTIATFAGGGALAGSAVPGLGTVAGLIIGAAIGVGSSILSNIKSQKADNMAAQKLTLTQGQANLNKLILLAQVDAGNSQKYVDGFNAQLDKISEAYANLKADASSNLNLMVEQDGTTQLARFDSFYGEGGAYGYYKQKMANALVAPNSQMALQELAIAQQSIGDESI